MSYFDKNRKFYIKIKSCRRIWLHKIYILFFIVSEFMKTCILIFAMPRQCSDFFFVFFLIFAMIKSVFVWSLTCFQKFVTSSNQNLLFLHTFPFWALGKIRIYNLRLSKSGISSTLTPKELSIKITQQYFAIFVRSPCFQKWNWKFLIVRMINVVFGFRKNLRSFSWLLTLLTLRKSEWPQFFSVSFSFFLTSSEFGENLHPPEERFYTLHKIGPLPRLQE